MARLTILLLLCSGVLLAQSNSPSTSDSKSSSGPVTVTGCVDRNRGDYVLIQGSQGATYELQGTDKAKLSKYLGQRVQVTGTKFPSMESSSDAMTGSGTPAPVTIRVTSIKTVAKECGERNVPSK